ncbi:homeobox protein aristaless-like 4 isoform X2 [Vulpes lagopus]|uniref:homeobox protein aristaless-like 4 isoform X2 n=1 Tax=Vulpes lagopus TaxID=494514 RepID=UPI001BCA4190|nr:homeobox protein aristaless-like 4 isoform X2 [Vulpes lagopus]
MCLAGGSDRPNPRPTLQSGKGALGVQGGPLGSLPSAALSRRCPSPRASGLGPGRTRSFGPGPRTLAEPREGRRGARGSSPRTGRPHPAPPQMPGCPPALPSRTGAIGRPLRWSLSLGTGERCPGSSASLAHGARANLSRRSGDERILRHLPEKQIPGCVSTLCTLTHNEKFGCCFQWNESLLDCQRRIL